MLIFLTISGFSATKPNTGQTFKSQRPPITDLYQSTSITSFKPYFIFLSNNPDLEISEELEWLGNAILNDHRPESRKIMLSHLIELSRYMPVEFRWMLAAFEVRAGIVNPHTIEAIKDVAIRARYSEKGNFMGILASATPYTIYVPPDKNDPRSRDSMDFSSQRLPVFLMHTWMMLPTLSSEPLPVGFEHGRLNWFEEMSIMTLMSAPDVLLSYLKGFQNPVMRHFTSPERQFLFYEYATTIAEKISYRGKYKTDRYGHTVFVAGSQDNEHHKHAFNLVCDWIFEDVDFLLKNLNRLEKLGVVTFEKMFGKSWSTQESSKIFEGFSNRKYDIEAQLTAGLMLLKQNSWQHTEEQKQVVVKQVFDIFMSARESTDLINVGIRGFQSQRMENSIYFHLLDQFYQIFLKSPLLTKEQGIELLKIKTVKTRFVKSDDFDETDRRRLKLVEQHLGYDDFKTEMTKILAKGTSASRGDQMQAAEYLGKMLSEQDRIALAATIKARFSEGKRFSFAKPVMSWETDMGWPVRLMLKVNPNDTELRDFLVSVIIQKKIVSAFSDGDALSALLESGNSTPELKAFIVRKLSFSFAGDTVNYFRALTRLHPEAAFEITGIVYKYIKDSSKLIPFMDVLFEEVQRNPKLLENIEANIASDSQRSENLRVYRQHTLSGYLQLQSTKKRLSFCRGFYGS